MQGRCTISPEDFIAQGRRETALFKPEGVCEPLKAGRRRHGGRIPGSAPTSRSSGDDLNQQGIRYCIFQMHQTYHGAEEGTAIGAKGLTGEAYNGNTFWDTEAFCLPFYLFNNPQAARNLLLFRYETPAPGPGAGPGIGLRGGRSTPWPPSTAPSPARCGSTPICSSRPPPPLPTASGIMSRSPGIRNFLYDYGAEITAEICRMLATRGDWNGAGPVRLLRRHGSRRIPDDGQPQLLQPITWPKPLFAIRT